MKNIKKSKIWSNRRKRGLALLLIGPITRFVYALIRLFQYMGYHFLDFNDIIFSLFLILSTIGTIGFIPGLIMLLKPDTDYNPNVELKEKPSNLYDVYKPYFDIKSLQKSDIQEMKYNGLITKLHIVWAIIFNILTLGIFSTMYYGLRHSDLPKIKRDDFSAGKAIGYLFIPFYNFYWICVFWLRFVDRINFQYTLRNMKKPVSRGLTIAFLICNYIPYLNILSVIVLGSILVGQIQNAVNGLVEEKEYLNND